MPNVGRYPIILGNLFFYLFFLFFVLGGCRMEYWDLVDANGYTMLTNHRRGDEIPSGYYHHVVNVRVQHQDGSILIMQRDWRKEILPGKFEASAGGSILQGETVEAGARRELWEETGIKAEQLIQVRSYLDETYPVLWTHYIAQVKVDKSHIRLQEGETIAFEWVTLQDFISRVKDNENLSMDPMTLETYYLDLLHH